MFRVRGFISRALGFNSRCVHGKNIETNHFLSDTMDERLRADGPIERNT